MPHRKGFAELIKKYCDYKNKEFCGIEIGCLNGEFATHLLREFYNLHLISIDYEPKWHDIGHNMVDFPTRFSLWGVTSDEAVEFLKYQKYDFVFIDGDHSYEQCKKDIWNYEGLVKPGGIISGHNYHKAPESAHPGVHESVDEFFGERVKVLQGEFIWYLQKPK